MKFCAVRENVLAEARRNQCQWPRGHVITWTIDAKLDAFSDEEYQDICELAWNAWEAKTGVRLEYVTTRPNIVLTTRPIDGQFGVLAEAELPCGRVTTESRLTMWADSNERWVNAENTHGRMIDFLRVAIHEFGHLLGISHITEGPAIMNPAVSDIRTLQPLDIDEGVKRYGDPASTPAPGGMGACEVFLATFFQDQQSRRSVIKGWELIKRALEST